MQNSLAVLLIVLSFVTDVAEASRRKFTETTDMNMNMGEGEKVAIAPKLHEDQMDVDQLLDQSVHAQQAPVLAAELAAGAPAEKLDVDQLLDPSVQQQQAPVLAIEPAAGAPAEELDVDQLFDPSVQEQQAPVLATEMAAGAPAEKLDVDQLLDHSVQEQQAPVLAAEPAAGVPAEPAELSGEVEPAAALAEAKYASPEAATIEQSAKALPAESLAVSRVSVDGHADLGSGVGSTNYMVAGLVIVAIVVVTIACIVGVSSTDAETEKIIGEDISQDPGRRISANTLHGHI